MATFASKTSGHLLDTQDRGGVGGGGRKVGVDGHQVTRVNRQALQECHPKVLFHCDPALSVSGTWKARTWCIEEFFGFLRGADGVGHASLLGMCGDGL